MKLPVVLERREVLTVLAAMRGTPQLVAKLLYGGGLRLRVHDVDFERGELAVRDPKGKRSQGPSRATQQQRWANTEKTRRIEFGRFAVQRRQERGLRWPETFDFLGFTHCCATTRSGRFLLKRRTSRQRMRQRLKAVKAALMRRRHLPIPVQGTTRPPP